MTRRQVPGLPLAWCVNYTGNTSIYLLQYHCSKLEYNMTSCAIVQSEAEMESIEGLCEASEIIWHTIFWFSTVTGMVGNSLAMITIASLPSSTATFYIGVLAFSDLVAILLRLCIYFMDKHRVLNPKETYWHIFPLLFDFTASYSNWLLVLICLERLITVRYPFQKRYYFTIPVARISAVILSVILFAVYNIATWNLGYMDMRMYTVSNLLNAVIPLFLILSLIVLIALNIRSIHRKRRGLQERTVYINSGATVVVAAATVDDSTDRCCSTEDAASRNSAPNTEATPLSANGKKKEKEKEKKQLSAHTLLSEVARMENSITLMMVVAAVCFALLTLPNCVHLFMYKHAIAVWNTPLARARWHVFSRTAHSLPFFNLAVNFFLYFLSTKKFRTQLCKVLHLNGRRTPESSLPLQTYSVNCSVTDNCL